MMKNAIYILMYSLLLGACTAEEVVIEPVIPETMEVPISFDLSMTGPATRAFLPKEANVRDCYVDKVDVYVYSRPEDGNYMEGNKRDGFTYRSQVTLTAQETGETGEGQPRYTASGVLSLSSGYDYYITAVAYSQKQGEDKLFKRGDNNYLMQSCLELTDSEYKTPEFFFGTVVHNERDTVFNYQDVKNDKQTSLTGWLYRGVAGIEIALTNVPDSVKKIELLADTIYTKVGASHYDDFTQAYAEQKCNDYSRFVLGEAGYDEQEGIIGESVKITDQDTIFHIVGPNLLTNICTSLSLRITGENGQSFCRLRLRDTDGHDMPETRSIPSGGGNGTGIILGGEETPEYPEEGGDGEAEKNPYQVCFKRNNYYQISGNYDSLLTQKYVLRVTVNPNWDMDVSLPLDKSEGSTE
ncbi:hypothetical protein [Parabacteroides sp. An277]|uniref:hypothetical protein n=1 Tax=Parabacteroides sp. An277 TaxID=1965619 RepID=UPI0011238B22|nr:hypothetical protein [Parabacteroides sp. An277]